MKKENNLDNVVFFDGICNLCKGFIQFILKHETNHKLKFAPLQKKTAKKLKISSESITFYKNNKEYTQSGAVIRILATMAGWGKIFTFFLIIPSCLRDPLYRWIAKNRYKWFGKQNMCMAPLPQYQKRFLE